MKAKEKIALVLAIICSLAVIVFAILSFVKPKQETTDNSNQMQTEDVVDSESTNTADETSNDASPKEFKLLPSQEPTNQGKSNYSQQIYDGTLLQKDFNKQYVEEVATDEYAVPDTKTIFGNQVYKAAGAFESAMPSKKYYQFYGNDVSWCDEDGWTDNIYLVRKEFTGERIYVVRSNQELDEYNEAWDKGQKILNGEETGSNGDIILNGRLLSCKYQLINGEYYIPLKDVGEAFNSEACKIDKDNSILYLPVETGIGIVTLGVPYTQFGTAGAISTTFTASEITNKDYPEWTDNFHIGATSSCYVPQSEVSRYAGWYFYTNGDVLSIVTDDLSVNNNFVLYNQKDRSAKNQVAENGIIIRSSNQYDPSEIADDEDESESVDDGNMEVDSDTSIDNENITDDGNVNETE